jgi:hypothetical protein
MGGGGPAGIGAPARVSRAAGNKSPFPEHILQPPGVLGGVARFIVVEVAEDLPALPAPGGHGPGPARQGVIVILTLVGAAGAVEADIDKIGVTSKGDRYPAKS